LSEVNSVLGYSNRRGGSNSGMYNSRPSPYDRGDRFGNSNRFQSRGSRNFKGANFSNNSSDYNNYDRSSSNWIGNNHNGSESRGGGRSPYEIDSWGESNQTGDRNSGNLHCVHMRGLPFKATAADIADVRERPSLAVPV
jgi:heterogeneous nuclear ribonucleoprotein F/H